MNRWRARIVLLLTASGLFLYAPLFLFASASADALCADERAGRAIRLGAAGMWSDSRPRADLPRDATPVEGLVLRAHFPVCSGRAASRGVLDGLPRVAGQGCRWPSASFGAATGGNGWDCRRGVVGA